MLFNSLHFLFFAPIVAIVYFVLPLRWQKLWLLLASLYFYAAFDPPFLLLLIACILGTFVFVWWMERAGKPGWRRFWLSAAVLFNLALLFSFKFIDFSLDSWNRIFGFAVDDPWYAQATGVVLPMGISFFTLQAIGYAVDIYRRDIPSDGGLPQFALFESFFPQLVAGPIMRARDLLHQFEEEHRFRYDDLRAGVGQIALGFFKKTIIADPCGRVVDTIFASPQDYSSPAMWTAAVLHALQIYGDFSGYTDIAIGAARVMGFRIPDNFQRPFFSSSMSQFWGRWHISLSSWLRDYIYIPLGGNRVGPLRSYLNLFVTMFISGLWHGAGLNYIVWGLGHALMMLLERFLGSFAPVRNIVTRLIPTPLKVLYAFLFFALMLLFFRGRAAAGFDTGAEMGWFMLLRAFELVAPGKNAAIPYSLLASIALLFIAEFIQERRPGLLGGILKQETIFWTLCLSVIGYCALIYATSDSAPFVYFQF